MAKIVNDFDEVDGIKIVPEEETGFIVNDIGEEKPQIAITVPGVPGRPGKDGKNGANGLDGQAFVLYREYQQAIPSDEWHIVHDLPIRRPDVSVFDNNGEG